MFISVSCSVASAKQAMRKSLSQRTPGMKITIQFKETPGITGYNCMNIFGWQNIDVN